MVFYEQHKDLFFEAYGKSAASSWPPCSRLLRLVRVNFAHNGAVRDFSKYLPLDWRELRLPEGALNSLVDQLTGPDYLLLCLDAMDELTEQQS